MSIYIYIYIYIYIRMYDSNRPARPCSGPRPPATPLPPPPRAPPHVCRSFLACAFGVSGSGFRYYACPQLDTLGLRYNTVSTRVEIS